MPAQLSAPPEPLLLYLPTANIAAKLFKKTRGGCSAPQWFEREAKGTLVKTWAPCGQFNAAFEVDRPHALVLADPEDPLVGEFGRFAARWLYDEPMFFNIDPTNLALGSPELGHFAVGLVAAFGGRLVRVDLATKREILP